MSVPNNQNREQGSVAIIGALGLLALTGVSAMAVDVGYMMVTKAELQNAVDAAAHSANRELGRIYEDAGSVSVKDYELSGDEKARIYSRLNEYAEKNRAAGVDITIVPSDVKYGRWDIETGTWSETSKGVNAIKVLARRDEGANGVVSTLMSSLIGHDNFSASARGGAALTPPSVLPPGSVDFPVGIAKQWFEARDSPCGPDAFIKFYPTGTTEGCTGWHTFESWPSNAIKIRGILELIDLGVFESPELIVGQTEYVFSGGTVASALQKAKRVFDRKKGPDGTWEVHLPVYDYDTCDNPAGRILIVGVATAVISEVVPTGGDKRIVGQVSCDYIGSAKGGGPDYGTLAGAPDMIE